MTTSSTQATAPELFTDSPEHDNPIFTQLYNLVRPHLRHYETDLIKHDRETLNRWKGPFIYGHRETGTGLTCLLPNMEAYEQDGIKVGERYLFGAIYDERQKIEILYNQSAGVIYKGIENKYFYYYDGHKLKKSTREQCEMIHRAHIDNVIREAKAKQESAQAAQHQERQRYAA